MSHQAVFCIAISRLQAGQIVDCLKTARFAHQDLSVLLPALDCETVPGRMDGGLDDVLLGATQSGQAHGALGWVPGFHALSFPQLGEFIAAGPIGNALRAGHWSAELGVIAGALVNFGFPLAEAQRYEKKIGRGDILVAVHTDEEHELEQAQEIFMGAGALDVCVSGGSFHSKRNSTPRGRSWRTTFVSYAEAV